MMDLRKWLAFGILVALAAFPWSAHSYIDQLSSPTQLSVSITTIKQWLWKAGQLATSELKSGSAVAQYTWTIENIVDKITKANHSQVIMTSPPFYTDVPGYRLRLTLFLYTRNTNHIGLYMGPIKGQFDDLVSWPFDNRYELSSAGPDGTAFAYETTKPSTNCHLAFSRPSHTTQGCGPPKYIDMDTLMANNTSYLIDGALKINVTIDLED